MATWLIKQGESVDSVDAAFTFSDTPLIHAARENKLGMVQLLLAAGADPNFVPPGYHATPLQSANSRDVALALFSAGADMRSANVETHRLLIGLTENPHDSTLNLNEAEFRAGMSPRFGESNPHELTAPYVIRMIQTGKSAYQALQEYKSLPNVELTKFHSPIWSAARFGQSMTFLPDGRVIQIAGEHEDYYHSDFCIYNDVFVHHPDGRIQVFGYPREVFPPTDFHSATSIGVYLYVLGNLGYANAPIPERTPVYRLNTTTYQIEPIDTTGESPHRLYKHSAKLLANGIIRVSGGSCDERVYDFDTKTHHWSLVAGHIETDPLKIRLDSAEMNERVRQADERVNAYWDGREPGGENEANDPQHMLAPEFFALYEAQHHLGGAYHTAAETAFNMWSYLDGGSVQIDAYLPKIIPGDQIPRIIRNSVRAAYERDGRMAEYAACFDRLLGKLDKKDFKLYMLADELAQCMSAEDNVRARTVCAQILSMDSDGYEAQRARTALQQMDTLTVGSPAPDFTRTDINGNPISLSALRERVVLIDFWATWCSPCIAEMPHLKRVAQTFADKPFTLLSISLDSDPKTAKHMIRQKDLTWTHILENGWDGSELSTLYGVLSIPQLYLIDALGRIRARGLRGHAIDEAVAALIDEI